MQTKKKRSQLSGRRKFVWKYLSNKVIQKRECWRSYRLIIPQESTFFLLWRKMNKRSARSNWVKLIAHSALDLITSGRREHGTVCCLPRDPLTLARRRVSFVILPILYFSASEEKKKGCQQKAQSACIAHTSNFKPYLISFRHPFSLMRLRSDDIKKSTSVEKA